MALVFLAAFWSLTANTAAEAKRVALVAGINIYDNLAPTQQLQKARGDARAVAATLKEVGFQVMVGAAHQLEPSLAVGAVGAILAFACPAPTACYEIYAAFKEGDTTLAGEKQERVKAPAQRAVSAFGVPGVKYAMDLNGYYGGPSRLPFLPLTGEQKLEIENLMAGLRS